MLNFAVGPVQMSDEVRSVGAEQVPYFRTPEFSRVMLENEALLLKFAGAPEASRVAFLTGSGTAAMEAAVMNLFGNEDRVLVVEGGSFGQRFVRLCEIHSVAHEVVHLSLGASLNEADLKPFENGGFTAFLVNLDETSTGVLYDIDLISSFCARNKLFLLVDAISAFLADPIDMEHSGIDAMIVGSQKALAVAPGVSALILDPRAIDRVFAHSPATMYFDLKDALANGERGQTPFTPAAGVLLQLHKRLEEIDGRGLEAELGRVAYLANDFRTRIADLPFTPFASTPSNAVTSLATNGTSARLLFEVLKDEFNLWICPNGGELADTVFRVGHIGELSVEDNTVLIDALHDLQRRGLIEGAAHA